MYEFVIINVSKQAQAIGGIGNKPQLDIYHIILDKSGIIRG